MLQKQLIKTTKLPLLLFLVMNFYLAHAQFPEGFEGDDFPPSGWTSFIGTNGIGTGQNWSLNSDLTNTGSQSASVSFEDVSGGLAQDWLVTPQFTPNADFDGLSFFQRQSFTTDFNTTYTIRVSTASQTNHADFVIIDTQTESDLLLSFAEKVIDLSAYNFMPIYVAFVMEQDDGDRWYIDDVSQVQAPPCNNNSQWGNLQVPNDGSANTTGGCVVPGDYVQMTDIQQGLQYKFTSSNPTDYITVRNATNNGLLTWGVGPQFVTALTTDPIEVHINIDDGTCGTNITCRTVTAECTTCVAYNNCLNAQAISCGEELFTESTVESTDDGNPGNCTIGIGNWYSFTPAVTTALNLVVTPEASYDIQLGITTTPDCLDFDLLACTNQLGAGGKEFRDFIADAGTTYYIYVGCPGASCTEVGAYDLQLFCAQENWSCTNATEVFCGNNITGQTTSGAIRDPFNPGGCTVGEGLWYKYTPVSSGTATVTVTPASDFDVQLSVLGSLNCTTFVAVPGGCVNTFQDGFVETLTFDYLDGIDYYFNIGNASIGQDDGTFDFSITCDDGFCNNTTLFPDDPISAPTVANTTVIINDQSWAGDYAVITNISIGEQYLFTNSASDLITIRDAVTGSLLEVGTAPVVITAFSTNDLEIHYNLDDGNCGTEEFNRTTSVECLTCGCPSSYTAANGNMLTAPELSFATYATDGEIESTQSILSGAGVLYSAGGDILLSPPFEVEIDAEFQTIHDGCLIFSFQDSGNSDAKTIVPEIQSEESMRRANLNK